MSTRADRERESESQLVELLLGGVTEDMKEQLKSIGKIRNRLLTVGAAAAVVGLTDLVPSKVETLGIEFDDFQKANFRYVLAAVVAYFLCAFTQGILETKVKAGMGAAAVSEWSAAKSEYAKRFTKRMLATRIGLSVIWIVMMDWIVPYAVGIAGLISVLHFWPKGNFPH